MEHSRLFVTCPVGVRVTRLSSGRRVPATLEVRPWQPSLLLTLVTAMAYNVQHVLTILGSFFFHLAVFKWFASPVLRRLWPVFATLPTDKQVSSQNYVMSLIHGAVVGGLGLYAFLFSSLPPEKICRETAVHHVCGLWMAYFGTVDPVIPYFGNLWLMSELSSPFLHLRVLLLNMGQKTSLLYKVNGVALLVVFFLCRILTIPLWSHLKPHLGTDELYGTRFGLRVGLFVLTPFQHLFNVFWFKLNVRCCVGRRLIIVVDIPK
ncbi:TMEM56 [Branchiostoma lanceolatum]|uniref:TMEM56 protein n=1 Tax=Branchiostoma lanceolatum TaxID=7740 RepID=A0A8K0ACY1_BRALA|nr:TMEM56 [Branchiostoma lanceolatum]